MCVCVCLCVCVIVCLCMLYTTTLYYSCYKGRLPVDAVERDHTVVGDGVLESTDVVDDEDWAYLVCTVNWFEVIEAHCYVRLSRGSKL